MEKTKRNVLTKIDVKIYFYFDKIFIYIVYIIDQKK